MKNLIAKIWVPTLLVLLAAVQSFGIDAHRAAKIFGIADSLRLSRSDDSTTADRLAVDTIQTKDSIIADTLILDSLRLDTLLIDTLQLDSLVNDSLAIDTLVLSARDTIKIPDSLQYTDPFFFKYYIAVKDSITRMQVRDSLISVGDTLELMKLDSLYLKDSTEVATAKFNAWYASLTRKERKKYDAEQALPGLIAAANRKLEIKDSIKQRRDSIIEATPRILETYAFPDSMHYKRIVTWQHDRYFHDLKDLRDQSADSSFNYNFHDYPFYNKDVNASWLGVVGSPVQYYDYFKRESLDNAIFFAPYLPYTYTPETLPQYNTKTPYTELCYYGTLFANQDKEESNIRIRTTQNITPELNIMLEYHRFGSNGMLKREDTDTRTVVMAANYTGKRYLMHTGYIYDRIERSENGGVINSEWIRDTLVDAREIEVYLRDASNNLKRNTLFLDQTYRIPFTFLDKEVRAQKKEEKLQRARRDSIIKAGDSLAIAAFMLADSIDRVKADSLALANDTIQGIQQDITTAFIGHSSEYSVFRKSYQDNISDEAGKEFYNNNFFINPTTSMDSLRVMKFENRAFIRLQPWKNDAIVSKLDVGIGDKLVNYYTFKPSDYIQGSSNVVQNSVYLYAGAQGQYQKYFEWNAFGKYNFLGYEINDFAINGNIIFKAYPFRKARQSPLELRGHFETSLKEPDYYQKHLFTNHFKWDNEFSKISSTKVEASLAIPRWKLDASFGYSLLNNNIYYDTLGVARQHDKPISIMTASLRKDFQLWKFHFDHRALFQLSSDNDVMPLPKFALNLRYYFEFDVVKDAMTMQIGANGMFTTKWYAPAYNPVLGVFHNQQKEEYGSCPYIDAFVNIQWKRVSLFVKFINANMGWPNESADYFTAAGYVAPQRALKFGITWPFYVLPGTKSTSASGGSKSNHNAGGGIGGGGSRMGGGSSMGSGMQRARR